MKCKKCGSIIKFTDTFCPGCYKTVKELIATDNISNIDSENIIVNSIDNETKNELKEILEQEDIVDSIDDETKNESVGVLEQEDIVDSIDDETKNESERVLEQEDIVDSIDDETKNESERVLEQEDTENDSLVQNNEIPEKVWELPGNEFPEIPLAKVQDEIASKENEDPIVTETIMDSTSLTSYVQADNRNIDSENMVSLESINAKPKLNYKLIAIITAVITLLLLCFLAFRIIMKGKPPKINSSLEYVELIDIVDEKKYIAIDNNGEIYTIDNYSKVLPFVSNLSVGINIDNSIEEYSLINKEGRTVVKPKLYDNISPLEYGFSVYNKKNKKYGYINDIGKLILKLEYENITVPLQNHDLLLVSKNNKYGLFTTSGKTVLDTNYTSEQLSTENIHNINENAYLIELNNNIYVYNNYGNLIQKIDNITYQQIKIQDSILITDNHIYVLSKQNGTLLFEKEIKVNETYQLEDKGYVYVVTSENQGNIYDLTGKLALTYDRNQEQQHILIGNQFFVVNSIKQGEVAAIQIYHGTSRSIKISDYYISEDDINGLESYYNEFWVNSIKNNEQKYLFNQNGSQLSTTGSNKSYVFNDDTILTLEKYESIYNYSYFDNNKIITPRQKYVIVKDMNGNLGVIDKKGQVILDFVECETIQAVSSDIVLVTNKEESDYYLYNLKTQSKIIEYQNQGTITVNYDETITKNYFNITSNNKIEYYGIDGKLIYKVEK